MGTFSKDEFKAFGKFVRSPYFYKDRIVIKLYDSLKSFYPVLNDSKLTKTRVFAMMYPEKPYNDSLIKYSMSLMFDMAKQFLIYRSLEDDRSESSLRLLKELNSRNTVKIFESELLKFEAYVQELPVIGKNHFHQIYKLKETVSEFYSYKDRLSSRREHDKIIENIVNSFLISILDAYYEILNDSNDFKINIELNFVSFIEKIIKQNSETANPVVRIFYYIFILVYRMEEADYTELLRLKDNYLHILDDQGKHRIYEALGNYCIIRHQQGGVGFYKDAFELIKDEIKHGVRFNRREFSEIFFTNKVEIAAKVKEFEWAEDFIIRYKSKLNEHAEDIVNFCYAIIEFESNNYAKSLDYLAKINLQHPLLRFRVRNYTLLNYYELNHVEQSYLMLDAYRHMLEKDKKVEAGRIERYIQYLFYYQKLLDIKSGNLGTDIDFIKRDINSKSIPMKEWLLRKADELQKN